MWNADPDLARKAGIDTQLMSLSSERCFTNEAREYPDTADELWKLIENMKGMRKIYDALGDMHVNRNVAKIRQKYNQDGFLDDIESINELIKQKKRDKPRLQFKPLEYMRVVTYAYIKFPDWKEKLLELKQII